MEKKQDLNKYLGVGKPRAKSIAEKAAVPFGGKVEYLEGGVRVKAGETVGDCVRDPQATPRFSGLLEGLAEVRQVIILMISVYYSKKGTK